MTSEQKVKETHPDALVQPWQYLPDIWTYCVYPDKRMFRKISEECDTPEEAWDDALRRIKEAKSDPLQ